MGKERVGELYLGTVLDRYKLQSRPLENAESIQGILVLANAYGTAEYTVTEQDWGPEALAREAVLRQVPLVMVEFTVYRVVKTKRYIWEDVQVKDEKVRVWALSYGQASMTIEFWMKDNPELTLTRPEVKSE